MVLGLCYLIVLLYVTHKKNIDLTLTW